MKPFALNQKETDKTLLNVLSGSINEHANLPKLSLKNENRTIVFNLKDVDYINSTGIRKWVLWHEELVKETKTQPLHFVYCSVAIVEQLNKVAGFFPETAVIHSIYVPYYCEDCDEHSAVLIGPPYKQDSLPPVLQRAAIQLPQVACPKCKGPLEPDFLSDVIFQFLNPE